MAGPAGLQLLNVVFLHQLRPQNFLRLGGFIAHFRDELTRADKFLGFPVALNAPPHLHRRALVHEGHLIDAAVARFTTNTLFHVDAVVEVDVVGKIVNFGPLNGLIGTVALADRFQRGAVDPDLRVAVHAGLGGRHHGMLRILNARVAVAAFNAHRADVVGMAERDRLFAGIALPRGITRIGDELEEDPGQDAQCDDG